VTIVTKFQALIQAKLSDTIPASLDFYRNAKAVFFFGTPHYGAGWAGLHSAYLRFRQLFSPTEANIASLLSSKSDYLKKMQRQYVSFSQGLTTVYFFEEFAVRTPVGNIVVSRLALPSTVFRL
jgi:hypothetical protein